MAETVPDSFLCGLAAAALEPGLRQVLLFDADFTALETAVSLLHQLLTLTTTQTVQVVPLTGLAQEDDLWGSYTPTPPSSREASDAAGLTLAWQDGWLTQNRNDDGWLLVVIPDLTRLTLAASRACITLLDAPVGHLERYGKQYPWQPHICWLAACARDEMGKVSSHLLDRFTLRLPAPQLRPASSATTIIEWLQTKESVGLFASDLTLPDAWRKKVTGSHRLSDAPPAAIQRVLAYSEGLTHSGVRRELALARLGRVVARLAGETAVTPQHINEAANLIGLTLPQPDEEPKEVEPPQPKPEPSSPEPLPLQQPGEAHASEPATPPDPSPTIDPGSPEPMPASPLPADPYPEDSSSVDRELFALQLPLRRHRATAAEWGVIIGEQPADSLQDLALIPTILEASLYQKVRRKNQPEKANGLILSPADLRRYRRVPQPEKMLLLLLDYTCLRDCEWQQALIPHLRWAYVNRASITIIQVGSDKAEHELRSQKITARSLLTPRIAETLEPQMGRATPLAHGLEMAYQTLQQAHQHGRSFIQETRFVVITDGRGNVPLAASSSGQVQMPVNREGIEDALHVAQQFSGIKRLDAFLLDPQPAYHAGLPLDLAEAIGSQYMIIPLIAEARL